MWFGKKNKNASNTPSSSNELQQAKALASTGAEANVPSSLEARLFKWGKYKDHPDDNKELVEAAVAAALAIPLPQWQRGQITRKNTNYEITGYCAVTEKGTHVLVSSHYYNSGHSTTTLFVDAERVGGHTYCNDSEHSGYTGVNFLFMTIHKEMMEREKPMRQAEAAEQRRQQEIKEAQEQQRIRNIMDKLR